MTTVTGVQGIDRSMETTNIWLKELSDRLGNGDRQYAYRVLRGFMHTLRDRMPLQESAQLAAQLPHLIRGVYYEGWRPSHTPLSYHSARDFLDRLAAASLLSGDTEASFAAIACFEEMAAHITPGEMDDVLAVLPHEVRTLLRPGANAS